MMAGENPFAKYAQPAANPFAKYAETPPEPKYDPTEGMSTFEKTAAGAGKAIVDTFRGAGQWLGLTSRKDVEEARARDAALMNTTAGKVGNFLGNVGLVAPASGIPGAATIPGAAMLGAGFGALQPSVSTGETLVNMGVGAAGGAGGQALANGIGAMVRNRAAAQTAQLAADSQRIEAAKKALNAGYVIPPADLPNQGAFTEVLNGLSGKIKTAQVASQKNQQVTNELGRKALGMSADDMLTADVLQNIRNQAATAGYAPIRWAGEVVADKQFINALDNIASTYQGAGRSFPGLSNNGVVDVVNSLKQPKFDAGDAIDATKVLREMADKAYRAGDTGLGKASKQAANEVESMLERHLTSIGQPDALKAFQEARKTIAKTYTVQKALNSETGAISAPILAKELSKGRPLSGELRTIAESASTFPKAMQSLKEAPKALSPLDFAVSMTTGAATANPLSALTLAARPASRAMLLSPMGQRMAANAMQPSIGASPIGLLGPAVMPATTGGLLTYLGQQ
jgi:histone H3/H4